MTKVDVVPANLAGTRKNKQTSPKIHFLIMGNWALDQALGPLRRKLKGQLSWALAKHWVPFKALHQRYAGTRFEEQRQLHLPESSSTPKFSTIDEM